MIRVLHVSNSAVAGAPYFWSKCYNLYGNEIESRCYSAMWRYKDGREFPHDVGELNEARKLAKRADVIVVHNQAPVNRKLEVPKSKAVLVIHSRPNQVDEDLLGSVPVAIIAQHQPRFYESRKGLDFRLLPNLIDMHFYETPPRTHLPIRVGYSPSFTETVPKSDVRWDSNKGYDETCRILAEIPNIEYKVFAHVAFGSLIEQARHYDVWIDECVTGSYHRSSLQAAAFGQVAINNADAKTLGYMARVTGTDSRPFWRCSISELPGLLEKFGKDPHMTRAAGAHARRWMEEYWCAKKLVARHHLPFLRSRLR